MTPLSRACRVFSSPIDNKQTECTKVLYLLCTTNTLKKYCELQKGVNEGVVEKLANRQVSAGRMWRLPRLFTVGPTPPHASLVVRPGVETTVSKAVEFPSYTPDNFCRTCPASFGVHNTKQIVQRCENAFERSQEVA